MRKVLGYHSIKDMKYRSIILTREREAGEDALVLKWMLRAEGPLSLFQVSGQGPQALCSTLREAWSPEQRRLPQHYGSRFVFTERGDKTPFYIQKKAREGP